MANWYGSARTNYVRLAPGVTLESLNDRLALIGAAIEVIQNGDLVGFLPDEMSDDGDFASYLRPDIPDVEADPIAAAKLAAALGVGIEALDADEFEFSWEAHIMPLIKEGEVLVAQTVGAEKLRYLSGYAEAFVRRGDGVERVGLSIDDIYQLAARTFGVSDASITGASY